MPTLLRRKKPLVNGCVQMGPLLVQSEGQAGSLKDPLPLAPVLSRFTFSTAGLGRSSRLRPVHLWGH